MITTKQIIINYKETISIEGYAKNIKHRILRKLYEAYGQFSGHDY